MNYQQLYIDGQWIAPARGGSFETFDPSDESLLARVGAATAEDIDTAVKAARAAFDDGPWPNLAGAERAAVLRRIAQGIAAASGSWPNWRYETMESRCPKPCGTSTTPPVASISTPTSPNGWTRTGSGRSPWPTSASVPWRAENPSGWPARSSPGTSRC